MNLSGLFFITYFLNVISVISPLNSCALLLPGSHCKLWRESAESVGGKRRPSTQPWHATFPHHSYKNSKLQLLGYLFYVLIVSILFNFYNIFKYRKLRPLVYSFGNNVRLYLFHMINEQYLVIFVFLNFLLYSLFKIYRNRLNR